MTIRYFEWSMFWETRHYLNWYEVGTLVCFNLAWLFSIAKTVGSKQTDGKSALAVFFVALGLVVGACYKLFVDLDVAVFGYLLGASLGALDCFLTRRMREREVDATTIRREKLLQRAAASGEGKSGSSHGSGHRHSSRHESHEHSSRRYSRREHERSLDASENVEPKEPKFGDDLKLD